MKLLLLHISDIHIRTEKDDILVRVEKIAQAVHSRSFQVDALIIVVTGDIAYSGTEGQYDLSVRFFSELIASLKQGTLKDLTPYFVLIPGNHDCDFEIPLEARNILIEKLGRNVPSHIDQSIIETCTEVQQHFFNLKETLDNAKHRQEDRLYYEYLINHGSETVLFRCYNTAWVSQKKEVQGSLFYPVSVINDRADESVLVVSLFHHPYNWLTSTNARDFRRRIEATSDIILTGHEHDFEIRTQRTHSGNDNTYLEGSALQSSEAGVGNGFNVVEIDTAIKKNRIYNFLWSKDLFAVTAQTEWQDYHLNRTLVQSKYQLSREFREHLEDLGASITHPKHGRLKMSDIFVYPDLREMRYPETKDVKIVHGEKLLASILEHERLLITGPEKSGKSCLAKTIFTELYGEKVFPVLIDGADLRIRKKDEVKQHIESAFRKSYRAEMVEYYNQLPREEKAIIIDNFQNVSLKGGTLQATLKRLNEFAKYIVLLSNDLSHQVFELKERARPGEEKFTCTHLGILSYGHVRRNELVEKWFSLDAELADDPGVFARTLNEVKKIIDTAIGNNFLPSYPIFILPLLQATQYNEQVDIHASTYGYYYELLIKRSLAQGSTRQSYDIKMNYLSSLAHKMFNMNVRAISDQHLREFHGKFEEKQLIQLNYTEFIRDLEGCQILRETEEGRCFYYNYIYYYFTASYIKDHIDEKQVQDEIAELSCSLHNEDSANILLFLAHLSKHPFIVDQLLGRAKKVFEGVQAATMEKDSLPTEIIERVLGSEKYLEESIERSRKEYLTNMDTYDERNGEESNEGGQEQLDATELGQLLKKINEGFRTLQILGQILKNFPGSLDGVQKVLLMEECYNLGLRILGYYFDLVKENAEAYIDSIISNITDADGVLSKEEVRARAKESLFGLMHIVGYSIVKRISYAVGAKDLQQVYGIIHAKNNNTSYGLIHTSIQLEQFDGFPKQDVNAMIAQTEKNSLAKAVLRTLMISHFYLYDVRYDVKQSICDQLGISYKKIQRIDQNQKLLES